MSRFGTDGVGTFKYSTGDTLASATTIVHNSSQAPQFPFDTKTISDRVSYRSKSGKAWSYQNYNLQAFGFKWSMLDEGFRGSLFTMFNANPLLAYYANGTCFGTFRMAENTWQDSEVLDGLFDVSFGVEETA